MSERDPLIMLKESKETIYLPWNSPVDPTGLPVFGAFPLVGATEAFELFPAEWEEPVAGSTWYRAKILVGLGSDIELAPGIYRILSKITDAVEVPVKEAPNRLIVH